jgi:hypothetical protein
LLKTWPWIVGSVLALGGSLNSGGVKKTTKLLEASPPFLKKLEVGVCAWDRCLEV